MIPIIIDEITILPVRPTVKGLVAFSSCIVKFQPSLKINFQLSLNSIAIYTRPDGSGYRLLYPSRTLSNGKTISIFFPINKETGAAIEQAIISKLNEIIKKSEERTQPDVLQNNHY